jgi:hypothetical protein
MNKELARARVFVFSLMKYFRLSLEEWKRKFLKHSFQFGLSQINTQVKTSCLGLLASLVKDKI